VVRIVQLIRILLWHLVLLLFKSMIAQRTWYFSDAKCTEFLLLLRLPRDKLLCSSLIFALTTHTLTGSFLNIYSFISRNRLCFYLRSFDVFFLLQLVVCFFAYYFFDSLVSIALPLMLHILLLLLLLLLLLMVQYYLSAAFVLMFFLSTCILTVLFQSICSCCYWHYCYCILLDDC